MAPAAAAAADEQGEKKRESETSASRYLKLKEHEF